MNDYTARANKTKERQDRHEDAKKDHGAKASEYDTRQEGKTRRGWVWCRRTNIARCAATPEVGVRYLAPTVTRAVPAEKYHY